MTESRQNETPFDGCPDCGGPIGYQSQADCICCDCGGEFCHESRSDRDLLWSYTSLVDGEFRMLSSRLIYPRAIERLSVDLDDAQLDQLSKHRAERRLSRRHTPRLWLSQCNYRVFPSLYTRASV